MKKENIFKNFFSKAETNLKKFKKSEIAIYAIALMLVAAGYYNYSTFNPKTEETISKDVQETNTNYANVGDAVLVSNNEAEENTQNVALVSNDDIQNETNNETDNNTNEDKESKDSQENEDKESKNILEEENSSKDDLVDVNTKPMEDDTNYYANSKLERDKMYAEMISSYQKIIENSNSSEAQKSIATQEITKINNNKNAIMICENLIITKGFTNCVILINEENVNIIVTHPNGLNTETVAQIQNIISRELGTQIENIHITEK